MKPMYYFLLKMLECDEILALASRLVLAKISHKLPKISCKCICAKMSSFCSLQTQRQVAKNGRCVIWSGMPYVAKGH